MTDRIYIDSTSGDLMLSQQWGTIGPFNHSGVEVTNISDHFRKLIREEIEANRKRHRAAFDSKHQPLNRRYAWDQSSADSLAEASGVQRVAGDRVSVIDGILVHELPEDAEAHG